MTADIRIITADDHPIVRQGLKMMIEFDRSLVIVAQAGDGEAALELIEKHEPDVAVLDIDMPKMDGFEVVRKIRELGIKIEVVFLTMHGEKEIFQEALDLGVKGYVLKDSAATDIVASIKAVAGGSPFISPSLSGLLLDRRSRGDALAKANPGLNSLSPTELKILSLIAKERTSKEIGECLFISHRTVESHRTNISRKLNLQGPLALVKFALAHKGDLLHHSPDRQ